MYVEYILLLLLLILLTNATTMFCYYYHYYCTRALTFFWGGDLRTAANVYEELGLYKEMVECYVAQDEDEEAEKIVRAQLAKERTPYMLSIMGFIKDDVSWYVSLN